MTAPEFQLPNCNVIFADDASRAIPVYAVRGAEALAALALSDAQRGWVEANRFEGKAKTHLLLPDDDGGVAAVLAGLGSQTTGEPCGPADLLVGRLPRQLPRGTYALAGNWHDAQLASIAWGLGAYTFDAYRSQSGREPARLALSSEIDAAKVRATVRAIWLGRDLINTPANGMGPDALEMAARAVSGAHRATCNVISGDALLVENFPMIHAVGRAATAERAPRLIDMSWGKESAPKVTIVGKGVCFDTGGLDLKPAAAMLLMKKDMGGAAAALALADMVMSAGLNVRLRVLIPAVENSVSSDAFRPGDILQSRAGHTVEIGNTDAEGRLVLADALDLADDEAPQLMVTFATLTGAARVALGPDLPPCFVDDDALAASISEAGLAIGDPVWRMPFWPGYDRMLDTAHADISNTGDGPFAGAVTAALFLKRFVKQTKNYVHLDIYGWRPSARPLGPKGGEPHAARTMFDVIAQIAND